MLLHCFTCFGVSGREIDSPFVSPCIEDKNVEYSEREAQCQDDSFIQDLQASLSGVPTDSAEARIPQVVAVVHRHLHARVVRLYGWSTDDVEESVAGHLVLLAVDWQHSNGQSEGCVGSAATAGNLPPTVKLVDVPGHRIAIPVKQGAVGLPDSTVAPSVTPLLQQAVHDKTAAVFIGSHLSLTGAPVILPPDCTADNIFLGATAFAALPLTSGGRLLGVLWIGGSTAAAAISTAAKSPPTPLPGDVLPSVSVLRQVAGIVSMCVMGSSDPDYLTWLSGSLRRLAAAVTLHALVGELCDAMSQHVRRRFLVDAVAHAAVVPEPHASVGFMLDHRPQPGGPGGGARWAAAAARQASMTNPGTWTAAGGAAGAGSRVLSGHSVRHSDSFTSQHTAAVAPGGGGGGGPPTRTPSSFHHLQRTSNQLRPHPSVSKRNLVEHASARSAAAITGNSTNSPNSAAATVAANSDVMRAGAGGGSVAMGSFVGRIAVGGGGGGGASDAAAVAGALPSLRAKGFQMSHTLLQKMVAAPEGRGQDGVYSGLAVGDCGRHVQDVHQPSRDVCMLMAGGVRGADMTTDASDSAMFASERSTGRIAVQSLVLLGLDVSRQPHPHHHPHPHLHHGAGPQLPAAGEYPGAGGPVLALYLAFPTRLPPLLVSSAHSSCRQLLSAMLGHQIRAKIAGELDAEFKTLCAGVPGSYAIVHSTPHPPARPETHANSSGGGPGGMNLGLVSTAGPLDVSGLTRGTALEPSIGSVNAMGAGSCKLIPMNVGGGEVPGLGISLGASAQLLAAFTDAGTGPRVAATHGSVGRMETPPGLSSRNPSGRVLHDGSATRAHGGSALGNRNNATTLGQTSLFESPAEGHEAEESFSTSPAEEGDLMLSSDPQVGDPEDDKDQEEDEHGVRERAMDKTAGVPHRLSALANSSAAIRAGEVDDVFPEVDLDFPDHPSVPPPAPTAVLTVTEADGTSSMRQHMGLLVESLMSTIRSTAQADENPFDNGVVSSRCSLDLELEDLRLSGVLGDGGSGVVLCGMLGTVPVAVKIIQMPEIDQLLLANTVKALGGSEGGRQHHQTYESPGAQANDKQPQTPPRAARAGGNKAGDAAPGQGRGQGRGTPSPMEDGGGGGGAGGSPAAMSVSFSKLKQARRDMLRNAMELAVMKSISHVNITTVYAVYDNVILERVKREGGSTAYALRREGPQDMQLDKPGYKPVFVALCMELCDAGTLAAKLEERSFPRLLLRGEEEAPGGRTGGRSKATRVLDMAGVYLTVLEIACALRYLHARRMLHRDIKSANILLRSSPTDPRGWTCKLADFGSALVLDQFQPPDEASDSPGSEAAGEGGRWFAVQEQSWGTITHMSPESMDNNSRVDASSDVFALGIVMWEITSGRGYRPYKELAPDQIGPAVRLGLRPTFSSEVPPAYWALAQQCWAAESYKRPSAVQVVAQIKAQLSQLHVESRHQLQQQQPKAH